MISIRLGSRWMTASRYSKNMILFDVLNLFMLFLAPYCISLNTIIHDITAKVVAISVTNKMGNDCVVTWCSGDFSSTWR